MATAACGMRWSWDSPMWCSGKKIKSNITTEELIDRVCLSCPWWKGKNSSELDNE